MLCQSQSVAMAMVVGCVVVATLASLASAYPFEVPAAACVDMSPKGPGHNNEKPQSSKFPYDVRIQRNQITNSESVEITVSQKPGGEPFAGLMVQVRKARSSTPLGTFQAKGDNARTVTCTSENDTGSHNSPDPKKSVTFIWTPPTNFKGKCEVMVTVAKTSKVFWVKYNGGSVTVK